MMKALLLTLAWLLISSVTSSACPGQIGQVIFEDDFPDDSGGWQMSPPQTQVIPPNFVFTPSQSSQVALTPNMTFSATDGDYCTEFYLPKTTSDGSKSGVGIMFWGTDINNTYMALLTSQPEFDFYKRSNGNWTLIFSATDVPSFVSDPTAMNAIRVVAKSGRLTMYLNNKQIKIIRAEVPAGSLQFGLFTEFTTWSASASPIKIKSFKVTGGQ